MKPSELFRAAARDIERHPRDPGNMYACWTLWRYAYPPAVGYHPLLYTDTVCPGFPRGFKQSKLPPRVRAYLGLLKPGRCYYAGAWWPVGGFPYQDERVLMLCFAAAIAEEAGE